MTVLCGIDRRLLQNVDWPLLGAMGGLVILSATTLASLHIGRAAGNVAFRQLAWLTLGLSALPLQWFVEVQYGEGERVVVRLDPFRDPVGSAENVIQAKIAVGAGQLLGKGVAGATQGRLAVRPEGHTDFRFAVLAERWG